MEGFALAAVSLLFPIIIGVGIVLAKALYNQSKLPKLEDLREPVRPIGWEKMPVAGDLLSNMIPLFIYDGTISPRMMQYRQVPDQIQPNTAIVFLGVKDKDDSFVYLYVPDTGPVSCATSDLTFLRLVS